MNNVGRISVLFIVPSLKRAGAETQVVQLVNGLDPSRYVLHLLTFQPYMEKLAEINRDYVNFHHIPRRSRLDLSIVSGISELIDEKEIDIVHATMQYSMLYAWLGMRKARRKPSLVAAIHTTISRDLKEEVFNRLIYQWVFRKCRKIIFVCNNQKQYWIERYEFMQNLSTVIYNGVDIQWFEREEYLSAGKTLRQKHGIPESAFVVACIAGFRREKGQKYLIEAIARLEHPIYILLAGDGEMRGEIEHLIDLYNLKEYVHILGVVDDVRPVLTASDVLALPSTAVETFSMAMLEAMAMCVPVIGSNIGGMSEAVFPGKTGALVRPGIVKDLVAVLREYVEKKPALIKMGQNGRDLVNEKFCVNGMIRETDNLFQEIHALTATKPENRHHSVL